MPVSIVCGKYPNAGGMEVHRRRQLQHLPSMCKQEHDRACYVRPIMHAVKARHIDYLFITMV